MPLLAMSLVSKIIVSNKFQCLIGITIYGEKNERFIVVSSIAGTIMVFCGIAQKYVELLS